MIAAFVPNLLDRSRFGSDVVFVAGAAELDSLQPRVVVVDLDRCEDPQRFLVDGATVIGFGSHVDTETHERAQSLGFDEVLPRSQFFRRLPGLLSEARS